MKIKKNKLRTVYSSDDLLVVEAKPQVRVIKIQSDEESKYYFLSFPYMQFAFRRGVLWAGVSKSRTKDVFKQMVYHPMLSNIYDNLRVCLGNDSPKKIEEAIELFWTMPFSEENPRLPETKLKGLRHWESLTRSDPKLTHAMFDKNPRTLGSILEKQTLESFLKKIK